MAGNFFKNPVKHSNTEGETASHDVFSFLWISDQMNMRSCHEVSSLRIKEWSKQISKSARAENKQPKQLQYKFVFEPEVTHETLHSVSQFSVTTPSSFTGKKKKLWVQHVHTRFTLPKCHRTFALNGRGVNVLLQTACVSCYYSKKYFSFLKTKKYNVLYLKGARQWCRIILV